MSSHVAIGHTINETTYRAYTELLQHGQEIPSRNGSCTALYDFTYYLENPRARHLCLSGRTSNIFQLMGETIWVLSGSNVVKGYLETMLPRAPQYSDDGITWRAGYGKRLFAGNQLSDVVEFFRKDGKMTRRAAISIFDPNLDTFSQLQKVYGQEDSKDFSCNNLLYFNVTPDNKFHLRVTNRSNDAVFGMGINITEFSVIQEMVFEKVREIHPEITLGSLSIYSNNFHAYDSTIQQVKDVCDSYKDDDWFPELRKTKELGVIGTIEQVRQAMEWFTEDLIMKSKESEEPMDLFDDFLMTYGNSVFDAEGQMMDYIEVMCYYFAAKRGVIRELDVTNYQEDLQSAIINSKFRKFPVKISKVFP